MLISSGCLLLLACGVVQLLLARSSPRAAVATTAVAAAAQLLWLRLDPARVAEGGSTLVAFLLACGALGASHRMLARRAAEWRALCDIDEATGCLNRRGFASRLDAAAIDAMRTGAPVALLALDLDHFKLVNDRFGHLAGDGVLAEVSAALIGTVGRRGAVARLGGEEFAVLLPDTDAELAGVMAELLVETVRTMRPVSLPGGVQLTMSVGIASERIHDAGTADALRARADGALYAGKRSGRDRALLWAPGVHSHATPIRASAGIVPRTRTGPRAALR